MGRTSSVTVTLQGKNFDLDQTVVLERAGAQLSGRPIDVSADRRTLRVLFDLSTAALGSWDVRVEAPDGARSSFQNAITVAAPGRPEITGTLTGLGRFVAGRPQTLSVSVANTGNVDGVGVPLILDGLPAGTVLEPQFELEALDVEGNARPAALDEDDLFIRDDGTMGYPMLINRVPAGGRLDVAFKITVPRQTNFDVSVDVSQCWVDDLAAASAQRAGGPAQLGPPGVDCAAATVNTIADLAFEAVPGAACVSAARDLVYTGLDNWSERGAPWRFGGWGDVLSTAVSTAFSGLDCASDVFPATKALKTIVKAAKVGKEVWTYGSLGQTCFQDGADLGYEWVTSMDPNEVVGPKGAGSSNAIRGEGVQRYAVYFENSQDATAPAQVVTVDSTLDPAVFDLSRLTFGGLVAGTTSWAPSEGSTQLDETIDIAGVDVQLNIQATKTSAGHLRWTLTSIDPATGALPEDPFIGFLPPNRNGTEGQGVLYFDVPYRAEVATGDVVEAQASIVFDLNDPIVTNTWSNQIDRDVPTAGVTPLPARSSTPSFPVTWTATDPTSDVVAVDVFVARDGGDYERWQRATGPGAAVFEGAAGHTYGFAAVAADGAGNRSSMPSRPHASTRVLRGQATIAPLTVTGSPVVGSRLTLSPVTVDPVAATVAVHWSANGVPIPGATSTSLLLGPGDVGKRIAVTVVATAEDYADGTRTSGDSVVQAGRIAVRGGTPRIAGKAKVGKVVTVSLKPSAITPQGARVAIAWLRGSKPIPRATSSSYRLTKKDRRKAIAARFVITAPGYRPLTIQTAPVKPR